MVTYKDSGVDIDSSNEAKKRMKSHVESTFTSDVIMKMGSFGGAFSLERVKDYKKPILISSVDGVGTKLMVASKMKKWDTVGMDLVNHCVNDILTIGAEPLFFLDYVASSRLDPNVIEQILKGLSEACRENSIPLIAGETAEMPGVYMKDEHDLVGCIVGVAEDKGMITGSGIREGDVLIGLESNGLHTNGYSLARKVLFEMGGLDHSDMFPDLELSIGEELLRPHRSYVKILPLLKEFDIRGMAHITGGGLLENIPRILPNGLGVEIKKSDLKVPPIFRIIQERGTVPEEDMFRTFNMGTGFVLVVRDDQSEQVREWMDNLKLGPRIIGKTVKGNFGVKMV